MATTFFGRIHDRTSEAALWAALLALAGIVCFGFAGTFSRYLFDAPIGWVPDWTGYLLCASVFLAAPAVTRRRMHIAMEFASSMLGAGVAGRIISLVSSVLTLAILGVLAWVLLQSTISTFRSSTATAAGYPIPRWWLFSILFYGVASSGLHMLRDLVGRFTSAARPAPEAVSPRTGQV